MVVRVSARGQANVSADGYICAREQLGQAERRVRTGKASRAHVWVSSVTRICFENLFRRFARDLACRVVRGGGGARSHGWRVHGCRGTRVPWNENHVRLVLYAPSPCGWAVSLGLRWGQNIIIHDKTNKICVITTNSYSSVFSRNDATRPRQVEHQGTLRLVVRQR
jgi:hypothetical protein